MSRLHQDIAAGPGHISPNEGVSANLKLLGTFPGHHPVSVLYYTQNIRRIK